MRNILFLFCLTAILYSCNKSKTTKTIPKPPVVEQPKTVEVIIRDTIEIVRVDTIIKTETKTVYVEKSSPTSTSVNKKYPPISAKEFRGAWVATVANITWPSKPGLSTDQQKQEAIKLLNFLQEHNFNAVILQVRPQADALYASQYEPWSYYLTGQQDLAPNPYYDPLQFWIDEAHQRKIELHAWLNPYRALHSTAKNNSAKAIFKAHPDWAIELANGMVWLDPANVEAQQHSLNVVRDLVSRYNIDGIHFDDYFYPYDSYNEGKDFPDDVSWNKYKASGGYLSRGDWRRQHVNEFIQSVHSVIQQTKPNVQFGVSPFGIWRPGFPGSVSGYDQYDKLYADAQLWLKEGWVDYFAPQLYWPIGADEQSFSELLGWWENQNPKQRNIWPGINIGLEKDWPNEIENQIRITRGINPVSHGTIAWSLGTLMQNKQLANQLKETVYALPALVPPNQWECNYVQAPIVQQFLNGSNVQLQWNSTGAKQYIVYYQYQGRKWQYKIVNTTSYSLSSNNLQKVGVTAVNAQNCESDFNEIALTVN